MLNTDGRVSVCAYSGCWQGRANAVGAKSFQRSHRYLARNLKWTGEGIESEDFEITVPAQTKSGTGFVSGGGFAMAVQCEQKN